MISLFSKKDNLNKLTYFAFTYAGLMSKEDKRWFPFYTVYQLFSLHFAVIIAIVELFVGSRELKDMVQTFSTMITIACSIVRALRFLAKRKKIKNLFKRLEIIRHNMLRDEASKHIVIDAENFGRKILSGLFFSPNSFPFVSFIWITFGDYQTDFNENHLVLKLWIPWNHDKVWVNILTNAVISILTFSVLCVYAAVHFMEITFTLYVSAYIKTLQNNLINKGIRNEGIYEQHKVIIQLINDFNEILSGIKYLETQISPLMPCGFGFLFLRALRKNDINVAVDNCTRAILCLLPSIITCYCGQQIITEMERLHKATYMSNWYKEKPNIRRHLMMMMIKTTIPTTMNYRLFVTFDFVLLGLVLQTIYSYLMLMINMDTE